MIAMGKVEFPKVLIISHNLYDDTNNIGKTLVSLFQGWPKDKIAQIYFRNDSPSFKYCDEYYCITDKEVLKSSMTLGIKKAGSVLQVGESLSLSDAETNLYQVGNHRRPIVSFIRDTMWALGGWKNKELETWVKDVARPDIILFAPNDYTLAYRVAIYIEELINKPLIPFYMDDSFYYGCKSSFLDQIRRRSLRKMAKKVHRYANQIFTICDYMSDEYQKLFGLNCHAFMNSVTIPPSRESIRTISEDETIIFSYLGNLHSNRWKSIAAIGRVLDDIRNKDHIKAEFRIYSASVLEKNVEELFNSIASICFMGKVEPSKVRDIQLQADVLVHVEAFDDASVNSTRLSLSTKIPEYLSVNRAIFAYGPKSIASMRYLKDYHLAEVCFEQTALPAGIFSILSPQKRLILAENGYIRANGFHNIETVSKEFQLKICENFL